MNRTFKEVLLFTTKWKSLGLTDEDLRVLENILLNEQTDLTDKEKKILKKLVEVLVVSSKL